MTPVPSAGPHTGPGAAAAAGELPPLAREVLLFWFGSIDGQGDSPRSAWFIKDPDLDDSIRLRFGAQVESALAGGLADWADTPPGALARLLLLDQFTRNLFRGSPRTFAGDAQALDLARRMVAAGADQQLPALRRVFVYLPFEHAEDAAAQAESLRLFAALAAQDPSLAHFDDYARRHAVVIQRYGRFPHRNAVLGRNSTPEELDYLSQPGAGF